MKLEETSGGFRKHYLEWRANHRKLWTSMARFPRKHLEFWHYDIELLKLQAISEIAHGCEHIECNCFACDIARDLLDTYPIEGMAACDWCPMKATSGEYCFEDYSIWERLFALHRTWCYGIDPEPNIYEEYVDLCIQMANAW